MAGKSEAAAVLVVVKSDPPDMGGDIWKRRCQRLKRKCEEFEQVNNRGNFTKSSITPLLQRSHPIPSFGFARSTSLGCRNMNISRGRA